MTSDGTQEVNKKWSLIEEDGVVATLKVLALAGVISLLTVPFVNSLWLGKLPLFALLFLMVWRVRGFAGRARKWFLVLSVLAVVDCLLTMSFFRQPELTLF